MPSGEEQTAGILTERPLKAYLEGDEPLFHVLTNQRVGLNRIGDEETTVRPANGRGAVASLTDRRVLFLVGDPARCEGDFVTSLAYSDIADARVETEMLTVRLEFEMAEGVTWSFTAREADVEELSAFLSTACDSWGEIETALETLRDHCGALSDRLMNSEWSAFDSREREAIETADRAREIAAELSTESVVDRTERVTADCYRLVYDRYVLEGRAKLVGARARLADGEFERCYERARTARERFKEATSIAQRYDVGDDRALSGLEQAEALAENVLERPLSVARDRYEEATRKSEPPRRVETLEEAIDAYRAVEALVTAPESDCSVDEETVNAEFRRTVDALIDARLASARNHRTAADWEWEADNDKAAYELYTSARDNLDRALELADAHPPGDADAIRERRDKLVEEIDPLLIRYELSKVNAELNG